MKILNSLEAWGMGGRRGWLQPRLSGRGGVAGTWRCPGACALGVGQGGTRDRTDVTALASRARSPPGAILAPQTVTRVWWMEKQGS